MIDEEAKKELIRRACGARGRAHAPYSNYRVGAALLTASGEIFDGVNVENASYPLTCCAERVAIYSAIAADQQEFIAIAVATDSGGSPCGACRQVIREFSKELPVILCNSSQEVVKETTIAVLLPDSFGPEELLE